MVKVGPWESSQGRAKLDECCKLLNLPDSPGYNRIKLLSPVVCEYATFRQTVQEEIETHGSSTQPQHWENQQKSNFFWCLEIIRHKLLGKKKQLNWRRSIIKLNSCSRRNIQPTHCHLCSVISVIDTNNSLHRCKNWPTSLYVLLWAKVLNTQVFDS